MDVFRDRMGCVDLRPSSGFAMINYEFFPWRRPRRKKVAACYSRGSSPHNWWGAKGSSVAGLGYQATKGLIRGDGRASGSLSLSLEKGREG